MQSRKILIITIVVILLSSITVNASTYLGTISHWQSSSDRVSRWDETVQTYDIPLNQSTASTWISYVMPNARSQWNNVSGLSTGTTTSVYNAEVYIYCGTLSEIQNIKPTFLSIYGGLTSPASYVQQGYYNYYINGAYQTRYQYEYVSSDTASVYLKESAGYSTSEKKMIAAHELGHAIGFQGHNPVSSEVMTSTVNSDYTISSDEDDHMEISY